MKQPLMTQMGFRFATMTELTEAANKEYREAKRDINRAFYPFVTSVTTELWYTSKDEAKLRPLYSADGTSFNYTVKELASLMEEFRQDGTLQYLDRIGISGYFDGYRTPQHFRDRDYDPHVAEWDLVIWDYVDQKVTRQAVRRVMDE
jgi:hypothetical protein